MACEMTYVGECMSSARNMGLENIFRVT